MGSGEPAQLSGCIPVLRGLKCHARNVSQDEEVSPDALPSDGEVYEFRHLRAKSLSN